MHCLPRYMGKNALIKLKYIPTYSRFKAAFFVFNCKNQVELPKNLLL